MNRPIANNISFIGPDLEWHTRTFLPIFDLKWAEDMDSECDNCELAYHCHPMVRDEKEEHYFHKLCTLTVIKAKLIIRKELL